jgi:hypothetical protein
VLLIRGGDGEGEGVQEADVPRAGQAFAPVHYLYLHSVPILTHDHLMLLTLRPTAHTVIAVTLLRLLLNAANGLSVSGVEALACLWRIMGLLLAKGHGVVWTSTW